MITTRTIAIFAALAAPAAPASAQEAAEAPSGRYQVDPTHAFLTFSVGYNAGLSTYRVDFTDFDVTIDFDADAVENSNVAVEIDPTGLAVNYPADYKARHEDRPYDSWTEDLAMSPRFMNADEFPKITFTSTKVERTGENTGKVTGDLTFLGVTKPVTMDVVFNGVRTRDDSVKLGFDATTSFPRTEFGNDFAVGYISEDVTIDFTAVFDKVR